MEREFAQDLADAELIDLGQITDTTKGTQIGTQLDESFGVKSGMGLADD